MFSLCYDHCLARIRFISWNNGSGSGSDLKSRNYHFLFLFVSKNYLFGYLYKCPLSKVGKKLGLYRISGLFLYPAGYPVSFAGCPAGYPASRITGYPTGYPVKLLN